MDILNADATPNDFQDWELLQPSTLPPPNIQPDSPTPTTAPALLHPDYFSLHPQTPPSATLPDHDDHNSASSDNPSWIDPASDDNPTRYLHKDPGGFWSDSSSEPSQDPKFSDADAINETPFSDDHPKEAMLGEIVQDTQALGISNSDSAADNLHAQPEICGEEEKASKSVGGGNIADAAESKKVAGDVGKRNVVWWKMPMDVLRYCVFKVSPVWALSVAAAVMGFVILGRKLYRMKKKKLRGLEIKLTVDDKKISQVMNHANRLNDAFSIVKRVPMIRPSLPPAVGTVLAQPPLGPWQV